MLDNTNSGISISSKLKHKFHIVYGQILYTSNVHGQMDEHDLYSLHGYISVSINWK